MRQIVRASKRQPINLVQANGIVASLPPKDFYGEVEALFEWVRGNIRYSLDVHDIEVLQWPQVTRALATGDCDDMAILLATYLECKGHPCRFEALGFEQEKGYTHVIVSCAPAAEGCWISLDPTENHPMGWFPPGVQWVLSAEVADP